MLEGGGSGIIKKPKPKTPKAKSGSLGKGLGKALSNTVRRTTGSGKSAGSSVRGKRGYSGGSRSSGSGRSSGSSGGYSRGGGGGGLGGGSAPKSPSIPSLSSYLGTDSVYQAAVSGNKRSLNDFLSEIERRRGEAGTQFTQTKGSMERDRVQQLEDLKDEYASRGLIQSGIYGEEQGNFQKKFTEQLSALDQQQAALLADLLSQTTNYRRENELALEQAKQEALLRRSQKYNIGG